MKVKLKWNNAGSLCKMSNNILQIYSSIDPKAICNKGAMQKSNFYKRDSAHCLVGKDKTGKIKQLL